MMFVIFLKLFYLKFQFEFNNLNFAELLLEILVTLNGQTPLRVNLFNFYIFKYQLF